MAAETKPIGTCWTGIFIAKITTNSNMYNTTQCRIIHVYVGKKANEQSKRD